MTSPLDLQRMAVRIETLMQVRTHGWIGGDDLEFKNLLPTGRDRRKIPDPKVLREMALNQEYPTTPEWRLWITMVNKMEGLVHQNDPRNPRRVIHDVMRGKYPGMR